MPSCGNRSPADVDGFSLTLSATAAIFSGVRQGRPLLAASVVGPICTRRSLFERMEHYNKKNVEIHAVVKQQIDILTNKP